MEEVQTIHEKEDKNLKKHQENESFDFKQKQELELQAFLKKQREQASGFQNHQVNTWNNLKEKQTQETWRLFGKTAQPSRPAISNLWDQKSSNAPSPSWEKQNPWTPPNGVQKNKTEALTH